ncbi:MAG TPA: hypothetical protein VNJ08_08480 [Bacteriovoracaceae bacterium]|nr:hypothetical protein [Bacteriovoracaceae bacterium]
MSNLAKFSDWDLAFYQLGSNVSGLNQKSEWFDLEEFFCYGINHSLHDARTFSSFSNLVKFIAPILAPFKIKKILGSGIDFDRSLLGYYLDLVSESIGESQLKDLYQGFTKATPRKIYFPHFKPDKKYSKWGKLGQPFAEPMEKFIDKRRLLSNYHVKRRFLGVKVVFSDVKSFQELSGGQKVSLNEISRRTHHDYASVHRADHSLKIVS